MQTAKLINDNLKRISNTNTLLDMLLNVEGVLDKLDMYAYENWIEGVVVAGPDIKRHWITITLMYEYENMPDPSALKRLDSINCRLNMRKSQFTEPVRVNSVHDTELVTRDGITRRRAKTKTTDVWLVTIDVPRSLVDEFSGDAVELDDDSFVDLEDLKAENGDNPENMSTMGDMESMENA